MTSKTEFFSILPKYSYFLLPSFLFSTSSTSFVLSLLLPPPPPQHHFPSHLFFHLLPFQSPKSPSISATTLFSFPPILSSSPFPISQIPLHFRHHIIFLSTCSSYFLLSTSRIPFFFPFVSPKTLFSSPSSPFLIFRISFLFCLPPYSPL